MLMMPGSPGAAGVGCAIVAADAHDAFLESSSGMESVPTDAHDAGLAASRRS